MDRGDTSDNCGFRMDFVLSDACSPLKVGTYNGLRILWITALSPQGGGWK